MDKIKQYIYNVKIFLYGFHYGIKHFDTIEDKHFFTYHSDTSRSTVYRKGIQTARKYSLYKQEILLLVFVVLSAFIFSRCGW
jgi:hypothetical protein